MATDLELQSFSLYPQAVVLPVLALTALILDLPPLIWHIRHRNVPASSLIIHLTILNLVALINPLIWPRDNMSEWYNGNIFCDIESRLYIFSALGTAAALICIFRELAGVLDSKAAVSISKTQKRRKMVVELVLCFGIPLFHNLVYYVVQSARYAILGISGCIYVLADSWVSIVLTTMWSAVFNLIAAVYAGLVIYRLIRYSRSFSTLIRNHSSTRSRFWRTFILCMVIICVSFPVNLYTFQRFFPVSPAPFSWTEVHADWNVIQLYPSNGMVKPEMWGSIVGGWLIFIFFGTGAEAKKMYRGWLVALGAGKIWPSLLEEPMRTGNNGSSDKWKLFAGKAKSMFSKRSSDGTLVSTASFDGTALNSPTKSYASTKMLVPRRFSGESEIDTKPKSSWIVRAKKLFTGRNDLDEGMVGEPVPLSDVLVVKKEIEE